MKNRNVHNALLITLAVILGGSAWADELVRDRVRSVGLLAVLRHSNSTVVREVFTGGSGHLGQALGTTVRRRSEAAVRNHRLQPTAIATDAKVETLLGSEAAAPAPRARTDEEKRTPLLVASERSSEALRRSARALTRRTTQVLKGCYQQALNRNQSLAGRVLVRVKVDPEGTIAGVSMHEGEALANELAACVQRRLAGRYTPFRPETETYIEVPVRLVPVRH